MQAKGIVASPGIAIGKAHVLKRVDVLGSIPEEKTREPETEAEKLRAAGRALEERLVQIKSLLPRQEQEIVDAQLLMLDSIISESLDLISNAGYTAAYSVRQVYQKYSDMLRQGSELFAMRAQDLQDLASRLVLLIKGQGSRGIGGEYKIVLAEQVDPIEFLELANSGLEGLATREGGVTSHVAILARLRGIPYVIAGNLRLEGVTEGANTVIDGLNGYVVVEPSGEELRRYARMAGEYQMLLRAFTQEAKSDAVTLDGSRVNVYCNVGSFEELRILGEYGCGGVGLFRIEFVYMERSSPPDEEELYNLFSKAAQILGEKPLTVRAPDIGGDKPVPFIELPSEENPQLGLRGARLLFKHEEDLLLPLVRALLRASFHGKVRLMLPMVSTVEEVDYFRRIVMRERERLSSAGVKTGDLELGVMVETPASALLAGEIVGKGGLGFISFGTNDLTQYVLAADRGNSLVGYLYNELNPAVLRLISLAVNSVKGRAEIEVCGEAASKPLAIPVLLTLGVESLSVSPQFVGKVKYILKRLDMRKLREREHAVLMQTQTVEEVVEWARKILNQSGISFYE